MLWLEWYYRVWWSCITLPLQVLRVTPRRACASASRRVPTVPRLNRIDPDVLDFAAYRRQRGLRAGPLRRYRRHHRPLR